MHPTDYDSEPEPDSGDLFAAATGGNAGPTVRQAQPESAIEARLREAFLASSAFQPVQVPSDVVLAYGPLGLLLQELPVMGGRYRLDFAIVNPPANTYLAIECDAHDYHERTREQAKHDRSRDRALTAGGWTVLRFTGSEIWTDAAACVREVVRMLLPGRKRRAG